MAVNSSSQAIILESQFGIFGSMILELVNIPMQRSLSHPIKTSGTIFLNWVASALTKAL